LKIERKGKKIRKIENHKVKVWTFRWTTRKKNTKMWNGGIMKNRYGVSGVKLHVIACSDRQGFYVVCTAHPRGFL
jgi:hypothetical protein